MRKSGNTRARALSQLIAKKRYPKAIEIIREELQRRRRDPRLRRQLADVLVMAGRPKEAVPILFELADDMALSGAAGKAIALLKRAQRLEPGQKEVEERLAYLITQEKAPSPDPWSRARPEPSEPPPPRYDDPPSPAFLGDLEEVSEDAEVRAPSPGPPPAVEPPPVVKPPPAAEAKGDDLPLPSPSPRTGASSEELLPTEEESAPAPPVTEEEEFPLPEEDEVEGHEDVFRDEVLGLIEDVFSGRAAPESADMTSLPVVQTPLFPDFSVDELVEVIRGLELRSFEPGEIVVTEGEPGQSLFVLTTGSVRTYVRDTEGRSAAVRMLGEGDFFGEVSLLEGSPRTATVTAAARSELLEIDRLTLGKIAHKHPRVWSVVRSFYEKRARSEAERAARAGSPAPGRGEGE
jgi:hypothetical protein